MKNINIIISIFILLPLFSFNLKAQNTPAQMELIKKINTKLEKEATRYNWIPKIRIVGNEFRILNYTYNTKTTVNLDKIKNIRSIKPYNYYKIKIIAPLGVKVASSPNWKGGSAEISGGMKDKNAVKELVKDLKKLISLYK